MEGKSSDLDISGDQADSCHRQRTINKRSDRYN